MVFDLLKFDIKNRLKFENKDNKNNSSDPEKDKENDLKNEMIDSILRRNSNANKKEKPVTFVDIDADKLNAKLISEVEEKPQAKLVQDMEKLMKKLTTN